MIELHKLERVNFSYGMVLGANDFEEEQNYFVDKHRRHNQLLHGAGIVYGLNVTVDSDDPGTIRIEPGLALDCLGHEICVPEVVELQLPASRESIYLSVKYAERKIKPIPVPTGPSEPENAMQASRIEEGFEFAFEPSDSFKGHKRHLCGWFACGEPHSVPLARLRSARGDKPDRQFVPPRMKGLYRKRNV